MMPKVRKPTVSPARTVATTPIGKAHSVTKSARRASRAVSIVARAWWRTIRWAFRIPPAGRRTRAPHPRELAAAALLGAGIAFLLDPSAGMRRRQLLRDRALAASRRVGRWSSRRARYMRGKAEGVLHQARQATAPPADDNTLADRVRTEIFRPIGAAKGHVNVGVRDRVVYLRGQVPDDEEIERLVTDAGRVPGVVRVENLLHTPGTPARFGGAA